MRKYLLLLFTIGIVSPVFAQRTSGGSTQSWRRYDVQYDTTYTQITENVSYPTTSTTYFRAGLIQGRGLWSEASRLGWPEDGFKGERGNDMTGGYEFFFGRWTNMTETNKNLHPAIDLSGIFEMGLQIYNYELSADSAALGYEVDYGTTIGLSTRLGVGATIKPMLFASDAVPTKNGLLVDVGANIGLDFWGTGETTYQNPSNTGDFSYDDESFLGVRVNLNLHLGVRYGFVGVYVEYGNDLTHLLNPTYVHENNGQYYEEFEENVEYNTLTYGISLHF